MGEYYNWFKCGLDSCDSDNFSGRHLWTFLIFGFYRWWLISFNTWMSMNQWHSLGRGGAEWGSNPHIVQSKGRQSGCQNEGKNEVFKVPYPFPMCIQQFFSYLAWERGREWDQTSTCFFESSTLLVLSVSTELVPTDACTAQQQQFYTHIIVMPGKSPHIQFPE
jgi:hypothetical protein